MKLSLKNFSVSELHIKAEAHITEDHVIKGTRAGTHSKTIFSFPVCTRRAEGLTLEQHEKALLVEAEELVMRMYEDIICGDGKTDADHSDPKWSVKLQPCGDSKFSIEQRLGR